MKDITAFESKIGQLYMSFHRELLICVKNPKNENDPVTFLGHMGLVCYWPEADMYEFFDEKEDD